MAFVLYTMINVCPAISRQEQVVFISIDGLSAVFLNQMMENSPSEVPFFCRLARESANTFNARCDNELSITIPNHICMLLGRPVLRPDGWPADSWHGFTRDYIIEGEIIHGNGNPEAGYLSSVFDVVHDNGFSTAFFSGKDKLSICYESYNETNGAPDRIGPDNDRNKVDYAQIVDWGTNNCWTLLNAVTNFFETHAPTYTFIHFADMDYIGHYFGWGETNWNLALADMDRCLGCLFQSLDSNPLFKNTTIILTADHGGGSPLYTHADPAYPLNYTIPFFVRGREWPPGQDIYRLFMNRFDPGTNRLDYNASLQPIRNGDAANLSMDILGLPPVPGSSLHARRGNPCIALKVTSFSGGAIISWPAPADGF